jgi:hypothetical protein
MSNTRKLRPPAGRSGTADEQGDDITETSETREVADVQEAGDTTAGPAAAAPAEEAGGTPEPRTFEFLGETYRLADRIGSYPMLMFQRYSNSADPRAMAAVHLILEDAIHPDDFRRWEDAAIYGKATDDDLAAVINAVAELIALETARRQPPRPVPQDRKPPQRRQPRRK